MILKKYGLPAFSLLSSVGLFSSAYWEHQRQVEAFKSLPKTKQPHSEKTHSADFFGVLAEKMARNGM